MAESGGPAPVLILGIGNVILSDEGFGVRCAEAFASRFRFPPHVSVVDGGTQGLNLLSLVEDAARVLVFDAINFSLPPATLKVIEGDEIPRFVSSGKLSLHQTGFQDLLAFASLRDRLPPEICLVGIQPVSLELGIGLSPEVSAKLDEAVGLGLARLAGWGIRPEPALRSGAPPDPAALPRMEP
jgi:hydrogenase maturation protease